LHDDPGNQGLMHVKCAIADRECNFLTSAALSGNAMAISMELGVCIHGNFLPEQVERSSGTSTISSQGGIYRSSNERVSAKGRSSG
jgi:hypothetical protein